MKDKIVANFFEKISTEFEFEFPPFLLRKEYEKQLIDVISHIKGRLSHLKNEYLGKLHSSNIDQLKTLIKITKEDFCKNPSFYFKYINVITQEDKESLYEKLIESRFNENKIISMIESPYEQKYYTQNKAHIIEEWLTSLYVYTTKEKENIINTSANVSICKFILDQILRKTEYYSRETDYFQYFSQNGEIKNDLIEWISKNYEESHGKFMDLTEMFAKYIQREDIQAFSTWTLNIGDRSFGYSYNRKCYNKFNITNGGKNYSFIHNNDGKEINDVFANLFILSNNELLKLCIGSSGLLQRTPYLLSKDIQRVDIREGNIIELHMHKHFDPETIIFDTEDEAYVFQKKVTELREQRRSFNNHR